MEFKELSRGVKEGFLAIRTAIGLRMTYIDTAELYGNEHAEELLGEAIQGFDRKKLRRNRMEIKRRRYTRIRLRFFSKGCILEPLISSFIETF